MNSRFLRSAILSTVFVAPALAQWQDGDLIIRFVSGSGGCHYLRVDPETGNTSVLLVANYPAGGAGNAVYDSYRDALLLNVSLSPDPYWLGRVWQVPASGSPAALAAIPQGSVHGLCSAGDGRIFFQQANSSTIQYLDASNQAHDLLDATGTAALPFPVEHLLYHPASNALLATTSGWWSTNDCSPNGCSIFRLPLSQDGSRVAGPVTCATIATNNQELMSMDYLPGGQVLLNVASGAPFGNLALLATFDPVTLAIGSYASPSVFDLDGAVYSGRIGAAVVLDDASNVLRRYAPGTAGVGVVIPTNLPVSDGTSGFSPAENLWQIDRNGPSCHGAGYVYGTGLAGTGQIVPTLGATGCPDLGVPFSLAVNAAIGGGLGLLALGSAPASVPLFGGSLLVAPIDALLTIAANGAVGVPGAGSVNLPLQINDPALVGAPFWFQAAFLDAGAVQGFSLSNGLQLVIG